MLNTRQWWLCIKARYSRGNRSCGTKCRSAPPRIPVCGSPGCWCSRSRSSSRCWSHSCSTQSCTSRRSRGNRSRWPRIRMPRRSCAGCRWCCLGWGASRRAAATSTAGHWSWCRSSPAGTRSGRCCAPCSFMGRDTAPGFRRADGAQHQ